MDIQKITLLKKEIKEIDDVLNNYTFDRTKAENIIRKHNASDVDVAVFNSPINPSYTKFENATDEMVANNLIVIKDILFSKLNIELLNN